MPIPESQLKTWSAQGSVTQSAQTYKSIKAALDDASSPYYAKSFSNFLQGSYGNDTNIIKDSDVDIVMRLDQTYYSDTSALEPEAKTRWDGLAPAAYGYDEFKSDVIAWLQKQYPGSVTPGKKAIFVKGNGYRRDADVLVCARLRRYLKSSNGTDADYIEGICFFLPDGKRVENFPEQHQDNCTEKHQNTDAWFKPMVRVFKNMRNRMIDAGYLKVGIAPSYFLEGMLWNVPNDNFGHTHADSFVNAFNWVQGADKTKLVCANRLFYLVRPSEPECWPTANFETYLDAAKKYWNDWK